MNNQTDDSYDCDGMVMTWIGHVDGKLQTGKCLEGATKGAVIEGDRRAHLGAALRGCPGGANTVAGA